MLDDNIIGLQLESGQDAVVDAAAEHGGEPDGGEGEYPANRGRASTQARPCHNLLYLGVRGEAITTAVKLPLSHCILPVFVAPEWAAG
jgi:hypothetical protein